MNTLNILIGLPGSGKSTYAKEKFIDENTIYLSSDQLRVDMFGYEDQTQNDKVFNKMKKDAMKALKNGFNVIYDATNLSKKYRKNIINLAKDKNIIVNAYLFCTPIGNILERNLTRSERTLPWGKLIQMIQNIDVPMYYEGFDNIYLINSGMYDDIYDYDKLIKKCVDYNQENPYHHETLEKHIKLVINKADELGKDLKLAIDKSILIQAAKYHDFGKLYTKTYNDKKGYCVFYGHERVSAYLFLCHVAKKFFADDLNRIRLYDSHYQIAALILNHMEWYRREDMSVIKKIFNNDDLYIMLELLHKADKEGCLQ